MDDELEQMWADGRRAMGLGPVPTMEREAVAFDLGAPVVLERGDVVTVRCGDGVAGLWWVEDVKGAELVLRAVKG